MNESQSPPHQTSKRSLRAYGISWIILSPIVFLMAAISTVKSDLTYKIQLVAFSAVALAGLLAGVGTLFKQIWAAVTLQVLSWIGATYFLGSATLLLIWPFIPGTKAVFHLAILPIFLGIAVFGIPFLFMAIRLKSGLKELKRNEAVEG